MKFYRKRHDGLYAVINNWNGSGGKIVFKDGEYETTDVKECEYLIDMGYAFDEPEVDPKEEAKKRLQKKEAAKKQAKRQARKDAEKDK